MAIYFNIKEMIKSSMADAYHIDNRPKEDFITENLKKTMYILDITRGYMEKPIFVNSGYRCKKLNDVVGGVSNSMHTKGLAADIRTADKGDIEKIYNFLSKNRENFKIKELIKYANFIHVAVSESLTI